ncbi:aminotransferase class V-fold PLP-dependent enzyme [Leptolyngbya sp. AN03gr2]|uniref:aminotransferase class V-fold PLP-dependent enzyme n=1 Tax=unclassified Leptolyngbya TaxID=2650499 RepID=UPI003D3164AB
MKQFWSLDPDCTFLNHGSFGACPIPVLEVQQEFRSRLERQPLRFLGREFEPLLDQAREALAAFVGASVEELVFIPNATTGVNAVLRSLSFSPSDELLTTSQEYNACRNALDFVAERSGAKVVVAEVPFPIGSPSQVTEAILAKVSDRTKLALIDHVVSQTGMVFPIAQIVQALSDLGIDTLIDGAHAPGMVDLNLTELGATYYASTCHKWMCAPKGAAFLYVKKDKQAEIRPLTISHGANSPRRDRSRFQLEFDWMGTDDPTAYLTVPSAIEFMNSLLPGGWAELRANNRSKALSARKLLCDLLNVAPPCPEEMIGSLATILLPDGSYIELQDALYEKFNIEVPIIPFPQSPKRLIRISAQIYNTIQQYEYLGKSLQTLLQSETSQ